MDVLAWFGFRVRRRDWVDGIYTAGLDELVEPNHSK